jgi:large subunit ribosomal protein L21
MYAIVETGGKQYRVKPGDTIAVERLSGEPGDVLDLGRVLLLAGNGDSSTRIGSPGVDGAVVRAEVVEHARGEKIIVFRYKSKVRYRRKTGHRQSLTRLRITDILVDGASVSQREAREEPAVAAPAEAEAVTSVVEAEATPVVVEASPAKAQDVTPVVEASPAEAQDAIAEEATPDVAEDVESEPVGEAAHEDAPAPGNSTRGPSGGGQQEEA